jgi:steroid delta-isomerase-like uncharacterized protein
MLTPDQVREMNEAYRRDFNRHDAGALKSYYADRVNWTSSGNPEPVTDPARIPDHVEPVFTAFPDMHLEFVDDFSEGLHNAHHWVMTGTHTGPLDDGARRVEATGKRVTIRGLTMMVLNEEGKIVQDHTYYDPASLKLQLGLA